MGMRADQTRDEGLAAAVDDGDALGGGGRRGRDRFDEAGGALAARVLAGGNCRTVDDGGVAQQGRLLGGGRKRGSGEGEGEGEAFAHAVLDALSILKVRT